jgi:hypothetical protein
MRRMKNWIINKRIYNIKRNANLINLGALLDLETFNQIQKIKEKKGIENNVEYVRKCYEIVKEKR